MTASQLRATFTHSHCLPAFLSCHHVVQIRVWSGSPGGLLYPGSRFLPPWGPHGHLVGRLIILISKMRHLGFTDTKELGGGRAADTCVGGEEGGVLGGMT